MDSLAIQNHIFDWKVCGNLCICKIGSILFEPISDGYNFVTIKKVL
jgi:hypothetical protein